MTEARKPEKQAAGGMPPTVIEIIAQEFEEYKNNIVDDQE